MIKKKVNVYNVEKWKTYVQVDCVINLEILLSLCNTQENSCQWLGLVCTR